MRRRGNPQRVNVSNFRRNFVDFLGRSWWAGLGVIVAVITILISYLQSNPPIENEIEVSSEWGNVCGGQQLPEDIAPGANISNIDFSRYPSIADGGFLLYEIRNKTNGRDAAVIETTVSFSITAEPVIDKVNIRAGAQCGAGKPKRNFPAVTLSSRGTTYVAESTFYEPGVDYLSLEPGEAEIVVFRFRCENPGLYTITPELTYSFGRQKGTLNPEPITTICPNRLVIWSNTLVDSFFLDTIYQKGWVIDENVRFRSSPEIRDDNIIAEFARGEELHLTNETIDSGGVRWVKVIAVKQDNRTGWVSEQYISTVLDYPLKQCQNLPPTESCPIGGGNIN